MFAQHRLTIVLMVKVLVDLLHQFVVDIIIIIIITIVVVMIIRQDLVHVVEHDHVQEVELVVEHGVVQNHDVRRNRILKSDNKIEEFLRLGRDRRR